MKRKEAVLKALKEFKKAPASPEEVYKEIINKGYVDFEGVSNPTGGVVSKILGDFIRSGDSRVKRIRRKSFEYYLSEYSEKIEDKLELEIIQENNEVATDSADKNSFSEKDLHKLLSTFLNGKNIISKTIDHNKSSKKGKENLKWIHPDLIGVELIEFQVPVSRKLSSSLNNSNRFNFYSYEIKQEITSDYQLKKSYFQALSNSFWSNYGYLVALTISDSDLLRKEMERLNKSFGIGIIELKANPFESKILYPSRYKELDLNSIDKLCEVNKDFKTFMEAFERYLNAKEDWIITSSKNELKNSGDEYFESSDEEAIKKYCKAKGIPFEEEEEELVF